MKTAAQRPFLPRSANNICFNNFFLTPAIKPLLDSADVSADVLLGDDSPVEVLVRVITDTATQQRTTFVISYTQRFIHSYGHSLLQTFRFSLLTSITRSMSSLTKSRIRLSLLHYSINTELFGGRFRESGHLQGHSSLHCQQPLQHFSQSIPVSISILLEHLLMQTNISNMITSVDTLCRAVGLALYPLWPPLMWTTTNQQESSALPGSTPLTPTSSIWDSRSISPQFPPQPPTRPASPVESFIRSNSSSVLDVDSQ